jgi:hypothetical protein
MVPIYDTDVAEDRYSKTQWNSYELWEKVEVRLRRRKYLWIAATAVVFIALSAVPIVVDRWPKWQALSAVRSLAQEINRLKRDASVERVAYRVRFSGEGGLAYSVERASSCSSVDVTSVRSGVLPLPAAGFALMTREQGGTFGVLGLVESLCYDFLAGSDAVLRGESVVGFGVLPVNDLTDARIDRLAILTAAGPSAEIGFE